MAKLWLQSLLIFCICFVHQLSSSTTYSTTTLKKRSELNQKHLVVLISEYPVSLKIQRNATGHVIKMMGASALILDWLSRQYKFYYSILDVNVTTLEDGGPKLPGIISYATRGECDVIVAVIRQTSERLRFVEFVHPWMYSQTAFIIPMPEVSNNNVDAVIKPFQFWVWMALIFATITVITILMFFNQLVESKDRPIIEKNNKAILPSVGVTKNIFMYVVGTLLNQGGYISNKFTPIRLVVGAWCLLTLVLLNVYNGILISYVTKTGRPQPLIDSFDDVLMNTEILIVVDKGLGADIVLSSAATGLYKTMGDRLKAHPNSRCLSSQQCVDLVKSLPPQYVYLNAVNGLKAAIRKDYMQNRQCKLTIAGEAPFMKQTAGWGLAKRSPYLEEFNRGTARLFEIGLISLWQNLYEPDTKPCYDDKENRGSKNKKKSLVRLSLTNLTGAFAALAIGCALSFLTFLLEIVIFQRKSNGILLNCI